MDRQENNWIWMPHPGHFICAKDCKFFLNTKVGNYIVSTVGELVPDSGVREINASSRNVVLQGIGDDRLNDYMKKVGYVEIGFNRKYETMVFTAVASEDKCCPWRADVMGGELDFHAYNDPGEAREGHIEMCRKWELK